MGGHEILHSGKLYLPSDDSIMKEQLDCLEKLYDYYATRPHDLEKRGDAQRNVCRDRRGLLYRAAVSCKLGGGSTFISAKKVCNRLFGWLRENKLEMTEYCLKAYERMREKVG